MSKTFNPKSEGEKADKMIDEQNALNKAQVTGEEGDTAIPDAPEAGSEADLAAATDAAIAAETGAPETVPLVVEGNDAAATELAEIKAELEKANQRWKVAQGMNRQKDTEMESMRGLLSQLAEKAPEAPATPATPTPSVLDTGPLVKEFGQDFVDAMTKVSASTAEQIATALEQKIMGVIQTLQGSVASAETNTAQTAQSVFFSRLTQDVPKWRELNTNPDFLAWLAEPDPLSGATKKELLDHAVNAGDVERAALFFNTYQGAPIVAPAAPVVAPVTPVVPISAKDRLVAPGKGKAVVPPTAEKKIWSGPEIKMFFAQKMKGEIPADEARRLELDIYAAQKEGRIAEAA